ncbi:MAG TPA: HAD-IA family hydrolase [Candidatus Paceibacterota bacterium]|nr:HAD-IA family hydrolase [Candidatus Paceibacterota bacterium]HPT18343.1 HAD-IA family hydrolase [Candidatus Paceibacterota bacterium]
MIKAIAFDYGGVIEIKDGDVIQEIANYLKITKSDWQSVYYTVNHLSNVGNSSWKEIATLVAQKFGATDNQVSYIQNLIKEDGKTRKINLELIEIIKNLRNSNYKIALLSNNVTELRQRLVDKGIISLFDEIIISAEVGHQKPSPKIFEHLFKGLGLKADEIVFVDDTEKSLEGAEKIGYIPILYVNNNELKNELNKLGIIIAKS